MVSFANIGKYLLEPIMLWQLPKVAEAYEAGRYENILKLFPKPHSDMQKSTIYRNIFRVLCLIKTGSSDWEAEYLSLQKLGQFSYLGECNSNYIKTKIGQALNSIGVDQEFFYVYEPEDVDKYVKKLYPMWFDMKEPIVGV
ncbi:hypothetical protein ACFFUB_11030 [Algimonas porphyrae]|uniref:Uncharacterized protein n=1 Tax=Algimonas porphyrae TaxID=1128113 RepID=A0ABQ5V1B6_9PROT|nr:hypothetical protein [Algimonas porphyrae]GLQ21348.1 hypothetical protein GCM10007854_23030 [Algimonas porphyrae]